MELITQYTPKILELLNQVGSVSEEQARKKVAMNSYNLEKLVSKQANEDIEIYFGIYSWAIGALKYRAAPVKVRKMRAEGLYLTDIGPYLEIADISVVPEYQRSGISKAFYNGFLDLIEDKGLAKMTNRLLIGGVGMLRKFYYSLYTETTFKKESPFIPKEVFGANWDLLEKVRPETKGTQVYSERLGLQIMGSSKTHGGPVYLTQDLQQMRRV